MSVYRLEPLRSQTMNKPRTLASDYLPPLLGWNYDDLPGEVVAELARVPVEGFFYLTLPFPISANRYWRSDRRRPQPDRGVSCRPDAAAQETGAAVRLERPPPVRALADRGPRCRPRISLTEQTSIGRSGYSRRVARGQGRPGVLRQLLPSLPLPRKSAPRSTPRRAPSIPAHGWAASGRSATSSTTR